MIGNLYRGIAESIEAGGRFLFFKGYKELAHGAAFGRPLQGLRQGFNMSFKGAAPFMLPYAAFSAATAPRGYAASSAAGALASPLGTLVGGMVAGPIGAVAGTFMLDPLVQSGVGRAVQSFAEFGRRQRQLEFGAGFSDSQTAWTMRQRAAQEMSTSLLNARHLLGREAAFMHQ